MELQIAKSVISHHSSSALLSTTPVESFMTVATESNKLSAEH